MSDEEVRAAIDQMEAWIADPTWEPDPEALIQWNAGFHVAVAHAEKADGWPDLVTRAHNLGPQIEARTMHLILLRDGVRAELDALESGNRALKGYGANSR